MASVYANTWIGVIRTPPWGARAKEIVDMARMRAFSEKNLEKLFAEKPEKPKIQAETKK